MMQTTRERQLRWDWGLAAAAAVALAFRLVHFTDRSLWYDESSSWQTAKFDFPDMIRSVRLNVHLPLYYTLLKGWMAVWGESVASLRGFSVLFGVLTVVLMGVFAGELYRVSSAGDGDEADRRWFARVVALLVAVSPFQAFYSAEARMYSLGTAFTAARRVAAAAGPARPVAGAALVGLRRGLRRAALHAPLRAIHRRRLVPLPGALRRPGSWARGTRTEARAVVAGAAKVGAAVAAVYLPGMALLRAQVHRVQQDYWIPAMTWRIFSGTFSQFLLATHGFDFLIGGWVVFGVLVLACLVTAARGRRGDGLVLVSAVAPWCSPPASRRSSRSGTTSISCSRTCSC